MKRICTLFIMIGSFFCFHQFVDAATPLQVVQKELQHISNKQPVYTQNYGFAQCRMLFYFITVITFGMKIR